MNTGLNRALPVIVVTILSFFQFAFAQTEKHPIDTPDAANPVPNESELTPVDVVGKRVSLSTAQEIKREKLEIVDSVVAEDINKFPDFNLTDAISRISGVQILQDRGEGAGVAIRGLTQLETLLNGREIFTAGSGRTLNYADIPSELLAGIDVYKTSSADHIEGGVGGLVDIRTHRPFDFKGSQIFGSARVIYGDLVNAAKPQFSTLLSNRWQSENFGEFGALINFSYQERAFREDQKGIGNPVARTNLIPGQTVFVPNGTSETSSLGQRNRTAGNLVLQWRPSDSLELYAEASYVEFKTIQNSYQINVTPSSSFVPGSIRLFPGSNDLQSITWLNAPISILSFARDTVDRTVQEAIGGSWSKGALTLKTDLSYTKSENDLLFSGPVLSGTAPVFSQDLSGSIPSTGVSGTNLLDPANFRFASIAFRTLPFQGDLWAAKADGEYQFNNGFFKSVSAGVRYAKRHADNAPGLILADQAVPGIVSAANVPSLVIANPASDFLGGAGTSISNFLVGSLNNARDATAYRSAFGITTPIPGAGNPTSVWRIDEETQSAFVMSAFEAEDFPIDGNVGIRVVRTINSVSGSQSTPLTGGNAPINIERDFVDYLPSLNVRYKVQQDLYLRAALSRTLTRQDFNQLSPSLVLIRNTVTPALNQGSAGNPALKPVRSDNFDISVEKYFSPTTSVYVAGFFKQVDGFLATVSNPEVYDGITYQVSRPQNTSAATINGFEVGYQQFYDFLPGLLSGLGLQANYTYVDSETPSTVLGQNVPLQNISQNSFNIIGLYEKGPVSARIAYNWRDDFLSGVSNFVGIGAVPVFTRGYGWLNASIGYRINNHLSISLEGTNLLGTVRRSFFGVPTRPQNTFANDTQVSFTASVRF
ncbi:MAG: TonB-dependent receptor [Methylobacter sp.]|nr:MAG: TonB-dependent receptor [Methylobacter sp.]PPD36737.1 MAG: TonB-dependent receptor [Methylomonas sp.]